MDKDGGSNSAKTNKQKTVESDPKKKRRNHISYKHKKIK